MSWSHPPSPAHTTDAEVQALAPQHPTPLQVLQQAELTARLQLIDGAVAQRLDMCGDVVRQLLQVGSGGREVAAHDASAAEASAAIEIEVQRQRWAAEVTEVEERQRVVEEGAAAMAALLQTFASSMFRSAMEAQAALEGIHVTYSEELQQLNEWHEREAAEERALVHLRLAEAEGRQRLVSAALAETPVLGLPIDGIGAGVDGTAAADGGVGGDGSGGGGDVEAQVSRFTTDVVSEALELLNETQTSNAMARQSSEQVVSQGRQDDLHFK